MFTLEQKLHRASELYEGVKIYDHIFSNGCIVEDVQFTKDGLVKIVTGNDTCTQFFKPTDLVLSSI